MQTQLTNSILYLMIESNVLLHRKIVIYLLIAAANRLELDHHNKVFS